MALHKFKNFYSDHRETFGDNEIINLDSYSVYTEGNDKVGSVKDALVDDSGRFRYLVVDTGPWIFGKKVLVPIGLTRFDYGQERAYVDGLTKDQVENLPEYHDDMVIDEAYETRVRDSYRPLAGRRNNRQFMGRNYETPVENSAAVDQNMTSVERTGNLTGAGTRSTASAQPAASGATARSYDYEREPHFYGMSEQENHRPLQLFEARLIANRQRRKVGEVTIGKHVETETARTSVPVEKERVIVERHRATTNTPATDADRAFQEGEVARMEVYEETADIQKQAYVREEVDVRKTVERENVTAEETVRREELDINKTGNPNIQGGTTGSDRTPRR